MCSPQKDTLLLYVCVEMKINTFCSLRFFYTLFELSLFPHLSVTETSPLEGNKKSEEEQEKPDVPRAGDPIVVRSLKSSSNQTHNDTSKLARHVNLVMHNTYARPRCSCYDAPVAALATQTKSTHNEKSTQNRTETRYSGSSIVHRRTGMMRSTTPRSFFTPACLVRRLTTPNTQTHPFL